MTRYNDAASRNLHAPHRVLLRNVKQGCANPARHFVRTKPHNRGRLSVLNLLRATLLTPIILMWLQDFLKHVWIFGVGTS
jgi:hypothetical protein